MKHPKMTQMDVLHYEKLYNERNIVRAMSYVVIFIGIGVVLCAPTEVDTILGFLVLICGFLDLPKIAQMKRKILEYNKKFGIKDNQLLLAERFE